MKDKLDSLLDRINKIKRRRNVLLEDEKVKEYISLDDKLDRLTREYKELYQEQIIEKCSCCSHLFVVSGSYYDWCDERSHYYYGCLKCGLDTLFKEEYGTLEEKAYSMYIKKHPLITFCSSGLWYSNHEEFENARNMYFELKEEYKDFTDEEITELMKIKKNCESRIRKKKLENNN